MIRIPRRSGGILALAALGLAVLVPPAAAEREGVRAFEFDRQSLAGSYLAGRFAGSERDLDAAAAYFLEALDQEPGNPVLLERTFLLTLASGGMGTAIGLAERLLRIDESHRLAHLTLGVAAMADEEYEKARAHFDQSGQGPLADLTAGLLGAWAMHGAGRTDDALAAIDALSGPEWYSIFKDYHAGMIAERDGRLEEAGRRYASAYGYDASSLRVAAAYIRFQARNGAREEAESAFAALEARDSPLLADLGEALESGTPPESAAGSIEAGAAEVLYGIGAALGREGGEEVAAVYLELALHVEPGQPMAMYSLAELYKDLEQHDSAIRRYDAIPEDSPLSDAASIQAALVLAGTEREDEAIERLKALIEQVPGDVEALTALGNVQRAEERFEEAAETYGRALAQAGTPETDHWSLFYFRGIAHERAGEWDAAEDDFQTALELSPEQPLVLNYLGYSWVDQGMHLDEAMEMIRRAVELRPEDGFIIDSLGWAYYRLGRYEEAVVELERAIELRPQDATINDHLGDAYWRVGRRLEARFQWAHARDLDPEPDDLAEIEEKLAEGLRDEEPSAAEAR